MPELSQVLAGLSASHTAAIVWIIWHYRNQQEAQNSKIQALQIKEEERDSRIEKLCQDIKDFKAGVYESLGALKTSNVEIKTILKERQRSEDHNDSKN